jgi:hypothetical protein
LLAKTGLTRRERDALLSWRGTLRTTQTICTPTMMSRERGG